MEQVSVGHREESIEFLKFQLTLYETLTKGMGMKKILSVAEQYFQSPIFVCDSSFNILSFSLPGENFYGLKQSKGIFYLDAVEIESMKRYKLIENIYSRATAFCSLTPDHPNDHWIFCAIRVHKIVCGYVAICYQQKEPTIEDLSIATVTANVLSLEMERHEVFVTKSGLKYEYFLTDLLEGQFEDRETIQSRLRILDRKIHKYVSVLTISCSHFDPVQFNKFQMEQLRSLYKDSMSVVYKGHLILLLSSQRADAFEEEEKLEFLHDFLIRNQVKAAFSSIFTNPLDAQFYVNQGLKALEIGHVHEPEKVLFFAAEMILFQLFDHCELSELKTLLPFQFHQLLEYDSSNHLELTTTLKAYLQHNRNAANTAQYLHIHRSTLFYRLKKIEELMSISINDSKSLFMLELAFALQKYLDRR